MYLYVDKVRSTKARAGVKMGTLRGFEIISFSDASELEHKFLHTLQSFMIEVIRLPHLNNSQTPKGPYNLRMREN